MAMDPCSNVDPFSVNYVNDMRKHLHCCFEEGLLSKFQIEPSGRKYWVLKTLSVNLYCMCRQPERGPMACCNTWYHPGCIYIPYLRRLLKIKMISFPAWAALLVSFVDSFMYMYICKLNVTLCRCFQQKDEEPSIEHKWTGWYRHYFCPQVSFLCVWCMQYII